MIIVPGNSGCTVEIIDESGSHLVRKSTFDKDYIKRLENQLKKQKKYEKDLESLDGLFTPRVDRSYKDSESFHFIMDYIKYLDCITFLSNSGKREIDYFFNKVSEFIDFEISRCTTQDVYNEFILKYSDTMAGVLKTNLLSELEIERIDRKIKATKVMEIPVGTCHGDLTFSNMLISRDAKTICMIDFLDNFVETPLQDMVKIRQDSKFLWTSNIFPGNFDKTRNSIVMDYLDKIFEEKFSKYDFYQKEYDRFQILNILRIFRYTSDIETLNYLKKCTLSLV